MSDAMKRQVEDLIRTKRYDELLQQLEAGEIDPSAVPEAIYRLSSADDPRPLKAWLEAGVDPNWHSLPRPLVLAAGRGLLANVETLLAAGADPNVDARTGGPLDAAVMEAHDDVATALLAAGADPEVELRGVDDLAGHAVAGGMVETVRALLERGLDADVGATVEPAYLRSQALMLEKRALKARQTGLDPSDDERSRIASRLREIETAQNRVFTAHAAGPKYRDAPLLAIALGEGQDEIARLLREHGAAEVDADAAIARRLDSNDTDDSDVWDEDEEDGDDDWEDDLELPELATLSDEEAARYDHEAVLERLRGETARDDFRAAVRRLEALAGTAAQDELEGAAVRVHVDSRQEGGRLLKSGGVDALATALAASGCLLVQSREAAVLLPTDDPLDAIAAFGVSGPNVDVDSGQILAFFRDHLAKLEQLRYDLVAGRFDPVPYDAEDDASVRAFATRLFALCPDVVYQGYDTLDRLCGALRESPAFHLWWD